MAEGNENWTDELTHEQLATPEAKSWLSKYSSKDEALAGGYNAAKQVGKPFKLPESMDKVESWPDENDRKAFHEHLGKLTGAISSEADLEDIDFAEGLADARHVNEDLVKGFKEFAVQEKIPKSVLKKLVAWNNQFATQYNLDRQQKQKEAAEKADQTLKPLFGNDLNVHDERVKRLFMNHCGLSAKEYEESIVGLLNSGIASNAILRKALYNLSKDIVPEDSTEKQDQPKGEPPKSTIKSRLPKTSAAIWKD